MTAHLDPGRPGPLGRRRRPRGDFGSLGSTTTAAAPVAWTAASTSAGGRVGPSTTTAPSAAKSSASPAGRRDRDHGAPVRRGAAGRPRRLVGEPGHRDPVRPAGLDAGLDRGADVVDVHVHVPPALAGADHHERVAQPGQLLPQPATAGRRAVEQVLHLVAVRVRAGLPGRHQPAAVAGRPAGRGPAAGRPAAR